MVIETLIPVCGAGFLAAAAPTTGMRPSSTNLEGRAHDRWLLEGEHNLDTLPGLTAAQFIGLIGEAHSQFGYKTMSTVSGQIDLVLERDGERTAALCRTWRDTSVREVQVRALAEAMAAEGAEHGIVITCGSFTREAREFASTHGITLVGGLEVLALIRSIHMRAH